LLGRLAAQIVVLNRRRIAARIGDSNGVAHVIERYRRGDGEATRVDHG